MLNEDVQDKLTEMMIGLARAAALDGDGPAADALCWTPLGGIIRAARVERIHRRMADERIRAKTSRLVADAAEGCGDLLIPVWG